MTTSKYDLGRHGNTCAETGEALSPGDPVVIALAERSGEDGLDRLDYSKAAWDAGARPSRLFAYWGGSVPESSVKPEPLIGDEALIGLFETLADADDPKRLAFRHTLCLALVRKRLLVLVGKKDTSGDEPAVTLVRRKGESAESEPVAVVEPEVDAELLREVVTMFAELVSVAE